MGDFYNGGLWGKSLSFVGSSWNFVSGCIINVDTHHESFSSKKTSNKKVIAKKPLTNLYEMNSNFQMYQANILLLLRQSFYTLVERVIIFFIKRIVDYFDMLDFSSICYATMEHKWQTGTGYHGYSSVQIFSPTGNFCTRFCW